MSRDFVISSQINKHNIGDYRIGILKSEWNKSITDLLANSSKSYLLEEGVKKNNINVKIVPGSMELVTASNFLFETDKNLDGIIALGCIIKGDTDHDKYIANAVSSGLLNVSIKYNKPVIFGVLTTNSFSQALERCGGKKGNKGEEAAYSLLKMLDLKSNL